MHGLSHSTQSKRFWARINRDKTWVNNTKSKNFLGNSTPVARSSVADSAPRENTEPRRFPVLRRKPAKPPRCPASDPGTRWGLGGGLEGSRRAGPALGVPGHRSRSRGPRAAGLHSGLGTSGGPRRSLLTLYDGLNRGPGGRRVPSPVGAAARGRGAGPAHGAPRAAQPGGPGPARPPARRASAGPGRPRRELIAPRRPRLPAPPPELRTCGDRRARLRSRSWKASPVRSGLRELRVFGPRQSRLRRDLTALCKRLNGGCTSWGRSLLPGNQRQDRRTWPQGVSGDVQVRHQEEFLHRKGN